MGKSLSITVHPSAHGAEYLTVSDAMRQVLDLVEALERTETAETGGCQIVWRLTEAHTNSPPFTVTAEAFSLDPVVSVSIQAARLSAMFADGLRGLLEGIGAPWIDADIAAPLKRAFQRNLNGIGRTEISIEDEDPFNIVPNNAKTASLTLERLLLTAEAATPDYTHTEYGAVEVEIVGIVRWNNKPALSVVDRLSQEKVPCILSAELVEQLGPAHKWHEAWDGQRLLVTGALHYGSDGGLKRIDAETADEMPWTNVQLSDLRGINILQGRTVEEHLAIMREGDLG